METNNRSQREKILRNFISGSEFAAIRISSVVGDQNSQMILNYHPFLTQISQSFILNISYLVLIKENNCVLLPPFNAVENLQITPPFLRKLKEKYPSF